ncbi:protein of unknown function [Nitratireductor aquimarinus]|uniref:hypothetical protein n=1 Tax=Nitratireductor aquimarinus TaxID=889300 RepID=UPI003B5C33BA
MSDTANYNWPKPRTPGASQIVEIQRVATALDQADAKAKEISDALAALNAAYDAHTHAFGDLTSKPSTVAGFGITDAYTKSEINTKVANDIDAAINALINGSPGALDTLQELATAMGNDPNFAATMTNSLATKVTKALNLSDIPDKAAARGNLGLGSAATASVSSFATAAQGGKADTAVQPGALGSAAYASTGSFLGASAKAVDSGKLNGATESYTGTAYSIAKRNSSGDLEARLLRSTYGASATLPGNREFIMRGSTSDSFLRPITTAAAAAALQPYLGNEVYTGSTRDQTTFPVGHLVCAEKNGGHPDRNQSQVVRVHPSNTMGYHLGDSGAILAGTWRSRGRSSHYSSQWLFFLMQRTA